MGPILIGTVLLGRIVPKGFIPSEDQSQLYATTEAAEGTSYDAMVKHQHAAAEIVQEDPNVDGFMSSVGGGGGSSAVNQGRLILHLKPRNQREMSATMWLGHLPGSWPRCPASVPSSRTLR